MPPMGREVRGSSRVAICIFNDFCRLYGSERLAPSLNNPLPSIQILSLEGETK